MLVFVKYLFLALVSLGIFVLAVFDVEAEDLLCKGGIILAFVIGLLLLNFFAKIAWKILVFIIMITLLLFCLNYFGLLEVSASGLSRFFNDVSPIKENVAK